MANFMNPILVVSTLLLGVALGVSAVSATLCGLMLAIIAGGLVCQWLSRVYDFTFSDLVVTFLLAYAPIANTGPLARVGVTLFLGAVPGFLLFEIVRRRRLPSLNLSQWTNVGNLFLLLGAIISLGVSVSVFEAAWGLVYGLFIPMLFYYYLGMCDLSARKVQIHLWAVLLSCSIPLMLGLLEFYKVYGLPTSFSAVAALSIDWAKFLAYRRVTFGNVLHTTDLILLVAPPAIVLMGGTRWRGRLVLLGLLGVYMANLFILGKRSPLIMMALTIGGYLWHHRKSRHARVGVLVLLVGCAFLIPGLEESAQPFVGSFRGLLQGDESTEGRILAARLGIGLFLSEPLTGVGLGNYHLYEPLFTAAHNMLIHMAAETGLAGFIGLAVLFLRATWGGRILVSPGIPGPWFGCWLGLAAFVVQATFAGANFATASVNVWGMLFWYYLRVTDQRIAIAGSPVSGNAPSVAGGSSSPQLLA